MVLCEEGHAENAENSDGTGLITEIMQSLNHIVQLANTSTPTHTLHGVIHRAHAVSTIGQCLHTYTYITWCNT